MSELSPEYLRLCRLASVQKLRAMRHGCFPEEDAEAKACWLAAGQLELEASTHAPEALQAKDRQEAAVCFARGGDEATAQRLRQGILL